MVMKYSLYEKGPPAQSDIAVCTMSPTRTKSHLFHTQDASACVYL